MRCIFCKNRSDESKGREHIIPESLGNKHVVLPRGAVCDPCNNYFSRKIEGPLLNSSLFKNLRGRQIIKSKKGKVPSQQALMFGKPVELYLSEKGEHSVVIDDEEVMNKLLESKSTGQNGWLLVPGGGHVDEKLLSRFLAKVGVELITHKICQIAGWESEIIENKALDPIRQYARTGQKPEFWPFNERRIYSENAYTLDENESRQQVVHEEDIVATYLKEYKDRVEGEFYSIVCIFGVEYAINLSEPSTDSYLKYLDENNGRSPLYKDGPVPMTPDLNGN